MSHRPAGRRRLVALAEMRRLCFRAAFASLVLVPFQSSCGKSNKSGGGGSASASAIPSDTSAVAASASASATAAAHPPVIPTCDDAPLLIMGTNDGAPLDEWLVPTNGVYKCHDDPHPEHPYDALADGFYPCTLEDRDDLRRVLRGKILACNAAAGTIAHAKFHRVHSDTSCNDFEVAMPMKKRSVDAGADTLFVTRETLFQSVKVYTAAKPPKWKDFDRCFNEYGYMVEFGLGGDGGTR